MTAYHDARATVTSAAYDAQVGRFLATYNPNLRTVVLIPGGMGSQLDRSPSPFRPPAELPLGRFDPVWMDFGILFTAEARDLAIDARGHDAGDHVIVANGPLRFIVYGYPYERTRLWAADSMLNYVVFGYDWRRPVTEAAAWLDTFLRRCRDRVAGKHPGHTMDDVTLLAHSQGGLVATMYLHKRFRRAATSADVDAAGIGRVVTVGTPFFSAATNIFRYFQGQEPLNAIYGAADLARIAGSLPGPYILNAPAADLFKAAFPGDDYPVTDDTTGQPLDLHDDAVATQRLPPWFDRDHMQAARREKRLLCRELPAPVAERLWHIRSGLGEGAVTRLRWTAPARPINAYRPGRDDLPFVEVAGAGDGTVPFWAAALPQNKGRTYDCVTADEHTTLAEHDEPLRVVRSIIETAHLPRASVVANALTPEPKPVRASAAVVARLCQEIGDRTAGRDDPRLQDRAVWRRLFEEAHLC